MTRILLLSTLILFVGCKSTSVSSDANPPIIMMEKTACMGTCPTYKFEVFLDKTAKYIGKDNVKNIGEFTTTLTDVQLDMLKNSFAKADYFTLANVYSAAVTDLPSTFIYYTNGKQNLKITDYYGAPERLKILENKIEEFIGSLEWQPKVN